MLIIKIIYLRRENETDGTIIIRRKRVYQSKLNLVLKFLLANQMEGLTIRIPPEPEYDEDIPAIKRATKN